MKKELPETKQKTIIVPVIYSSILIYQTSAHHLGVSIGIKKTLLDFKIIEE